MSQYFRDNRRVLALERVIGGSGGVGERGHTLDASEG